MTATCPLCTSGRTFTTRTFSLAALRQEWSAFFGFDPFAEFVDLGSSLHQHRCATCDLEFFSPACPGGPGFYERLAQLDWYYGAQQWEFDEALRRLGRQPATRTLLEIGCGRGFFLEKVDGCYDVTGIETNPSAVAICRGKGLNVSPNPVESLTGTFDVIVAFEVLEHIQDPRAFLAATCTRLAPGGTLILALPNPDGYQSELDHMLLDMPPHHASRWSARTLEYAAREFGLQLIDLAREPLRYSHYRLYMETLALRQAPASTGSIKDRIHRRMGRLLFRTLGEMLLPFGYVYHRQHLLGQTHLAEYRKL